VTIVLDEPTTGTERHGLATDDERALLAWADAHPIATDKPEAENGRYKLPHPDTGADTAWTRVTTFIEALDDGQGLTIWKLGLTVRGLVHNDALYTQAKAEHDNDKALRAIAEEAHLWAGSKLSAAIGTALHLATEHHDLGTGHRPPDPWGAHVDAWAAALVDHGITVLPEWVESVVVNTAVGCAGTLDRLVMLPDGRVVVLDIKTGKDPKKATYAVQAGVYANASHAWSPTGYRALPDDLDRSTAVIAHLSATDATCSMLAVDAATGWERAQIVTQVREARRVRGLFTKLPTSGLVDRAIAEVRAAKADPVADDGPVKVGDLLPTLEASLRARGVDPAQPDGGDQLAGRANEARDRLKALRSDPDAVATVKTLWPAVIAPKPPWTHDELDAIERVLHAADGKESTWLGLPDPELVAKVETARERLAPVAEPAPSPDDKVAPTARTELLAAIKAMGADARDRAAGWANEAKTNGAPWGSSAAGRMTIRTYWLTRASAACAGHLVDDDLAPDDLTRACLALVLGEDVAPAITTGAAIGALTIDEAQRLEALATAYAQGDETVAADIGAAVVRVA